MLPSHLLALLLDLFALLLNLLDILGQKYKY